MIHYKLLVTTLALAFLTMACSSDNEKPKGVAPAKGADAKRMRPAPEPAAIAVEPIRMGEASTYYVTTANLEAEHHAEVLARTTGVVLELVVEEGDQVEENQVLLRMEDKDQQLQLRQAQLNLTQLQREHERIIAMRESGVLSAQEIEASQNAVETAAAQVEEAELNLTYTTVRAPFSGRIVRRHVDLGAQAQQGTPLFEIMDINPLLAKVFIPANRIGAISVGQRIDLTLDSNGNQLTGTISLISPIVDTNTGTVKVTAEIFNYPPNTRAGDFAEVRVRTDTHENAMLIPSVAVFEDKGDDVVYVAKNGKAERRTVEVGFVNEGETEIKDGLAANELVVVKGQRSLRDGQPVEILEGPPKALTMKPDQPLREAAL